MQKLNLQKSKWITVAPRENSNYWETIKFTADKHILSDFKRFGGAKQNKSLILLK